MTQQPLPDAPRAQIARAMATDAPWQRLDCLLEALAALRQAHAHAIVQASLWYLPAKGATVMQRLRGRYLARPDRRAWPRQRLDRLLASHHPKWSDPVFGILRDRIDQAPGQVFCGDYVSIFSPAAWYASAPYQQLLRPLDVHNAYACYWRVDPLHCLNISIWMGPSPSDLTARICAGADEIYPLLYPLMHRVFVEDTVGRILEALTERQHAVLNLVLAGYSEKQIAGRLHRSINTVHSHIRELYRQFDVQSRAELMAMFITAALPDRTDPAAPQ